MRSPSFPAVTVLLLLSKVPSNYLFIVDIIKKKGEKKVGKKNKYI